MSKGTIVRIILVIIVMINLILKSCGIDVIKVDEATIYQAVEAIIEVAIIIVAAWKNNSVTDKAIKADEFLKKLKNSE